MIKPANKIVVLKPASPAQVGVKSGAITVVQAKPPELGEVISVGGGKQPVKMEAGDIIAYRQFGESKFYLGGTEHIFVGFDDVLAVIKKGKS